MVLDNRNCFTEEIIHLKLKYSTTSLKITKMRIIAVNHIMH